MKKLIKHLSCLLISMLAFTSLTSCSDDDNESGKIELSKGESTQVSVAANTSSGSIKFTAAAPWSAYTSAQSRSSDGVDWIHLNTTSGSAGEVTLTFTLDSNNTGSNRTAYIIIVCDGETLTITITQTTETDPDEEEGDEPQQTNGGIININVQSYYNDANGYVLDSYYSTYSFEYRSGRPYRMVSESRDDIDSGPDAPADHDSYCINHETTDFSWESDLQSVKVTMQNNVTYYPSERTEIEDKSEHYAEFKDGRAVKGWYKWDDEDRADWEATYDNAGYLASTKNNDGTSTWDTYTYSWKDGCVEKIVWTANKRVVFTYADPSLKNLHSTFDLNWVLPTDFEYYDFAAGDVTKVFAITGLMGNPSSLLLTAITEYTSDNRTYSYRMTYKENTANRTVVTVMSFVDDVQTGYQDWIIEYSNIK